MPRERQIVADSMPRAIGETTGFTVPPSARFVPFEGAAKVGLA
jgi:hypothetical protein